VDMGSGWGAMMRAMGRAFPKAKITGLEFLFAPYIYSVICGIFNQNQKYKLCDMWKYLDKTGEKFDVGVSFLLDIQMGQMEKYMDRFKLFISIDFPLPNMKPYKKIKLHRERFAQHWLYVYKK